MDPLSITVGIIALIGATKQVAVGLNKLASLRGAPAAVLALNNELSDLRLVLSEAEPLLLKHVQATLGSKKDVPPRVENDMFKLSLERAKDRLTELESILQNRLMSRMGAKDRLGWLMEQGKVRRALEDLRTVRLNIAGILGIVTSSTSLRIETSLQEVQIANEQGHAAVSQALTTLSSQQGAAEQAFASMISAQENHKAVLERVEASVTAKDHLSRKMDSDTTTPADPKLPSRRYSDSPGSVFREDSFSALRMRFLRKHKCDVWCDCNCHTHVRAQTPDMLQSILGTLFVGYAGLPALTPSCSNVKCRRASDGFLQVNYYFPRWFLTRIISGAMRFQDSKIPNISMRVLNVRSNYEKIFISARENDADLVEYQLNTGQASVLDVSEDGGHSPLHYAIGKSNVEVIRVLLRMGAEPYLENRTQETPYDMAWNLIFYFQGTPNASAWRVDEMRALFPTMDTVEERRKFTRIHKIILQILHLDLEKELLKDRSMIDQVDTDGRTPLSWAAARGDSKSVEALLRHGASPDTPDRIGQGPLRQAMKAHDSACARLLLAYGAKVDEKDNWKQTALLSAMYYTDPVSLAKPLLDAGAQVNVRDSRGHSPLMEAVRCNHANAVKLLLEYGADADCSNHDGCTPLHIGVRHNCHEALAILLQFDVDHAIHDKGKRTVLHWAAEFADLKTLGLLSLERLHGLHADDQCDNGLTAIDIAEKRREQETTRGTQYNTVLSEWITAFSDLLESLMVFNTPKSVLSYTGSVVSEDFFVDAIHGLDFEEKAELAEDGGIPHLVEYV